MAKSSRIIDGLKTNTSYSFWVRAKNTMGVWSDLPTVVTRTTIKDTTTPAVLSSITLLLLAGAFHLKWAKPATLDLRGGGYKVYVFTSNTPASAVLIKEVGYTSDSTQVLIGEKSQDASITITAGVTYFFWVTTLDASGNESAKVATTPTSGSVAVAGVTDHGALTGLADDDHPQYRLESEDHDHSSTGLQAGNIPASSVKIPGGIGTPTYDDVQDFLRTTRSSGRITGGEVSAYISPPTADGKVSISAMEGMIFTTDTLGGNYIFFKQAAGSVDLTVLADNTVYWIYFDWNSGTPQYAATATRSNIHEYDQFPVGMAWRSGNTVAVILTGHNIWNQDRRSHDRLILKYGNMDRVSGGIVSQHADALRIQVNAGSWYVADLPFITPLGNTFYVWYKSGSSTWVKSTEVTLFSDIFDGAAARTYNTYQNGDNLAALNNKYGVYWVFLSPVGLLNILLGTTTYANIALAEAATVPSTLPPHLVDWCRLIGKIICYDGAATLYSVQTVFDSCFTLSAAIDHGSLSGLGDDDHIQYIKHALATAANDFLVASGAGVFVKKTLAETQALIGGGAGGVSFATAAVLGTL